MLGIAIVGAGAIANAHADAFLEHKDKCRIVAICDIFMEKAQDIIDTKKLEGTVAIKDYKDALNLSNVDAVSICLPPRAHSPVALDALNAGKHVLVEKPMATSLKECDEMIDAAKANNCILSPVAQNRYRTPYYRVKQLLENGDAGAVRHIMINSLWWRGQSYYDLWWRGTWENECGGCVASHAVHHIDMLNWYVGMPKSVTAVINNVGHYNSECEDIGIAILEYDNMIAQLTVSLLSHEDEQSVVIQTEKARLSIPWNPAVSKALPNGFPTKDEQALAAIQAGYNQLPPLKTEGHAAQIGNFLNAIAKKEPLFIEANAGRQTIEIIMAIYKASVTKQPVTLPLNKSDTFYNLDTMVAAMPRFYQKTKSVENFSENVITIGSDVNK
ncbi:MAG: Gfo/Idh/MocA family oxidoreductase [Defluviitaleaceae bacterium]|nr:Gfo/Idh/MocA family oxidoreductase [Defluviitaleaceae bacterium]